jgi:hypothetical protein
MNGHCLIPQRIQEQNSAYGLLQHFFIFQATNEHEYPLTGC